MATIKQSNAARENIKKAQAVWQGMSHRQRALSQPEGSKRAKPGSKSTGDYYRVIVRPEEEFVSFRTQDVGKPGGLQRVAGHRSSGSWATQAWLIGKDKAHKEGSTLAPDDNEAKELLDSLRSSPVHVKGDIFKAKDRRNIPEVDKPTQAQQTAQKENIKKAQAARWPKSK